MNEIIVLGGLILAGATGYGVRAVLAKLEEMPADLAQVLIGFNRCDRCEFGGGHQAAAAHLGSALLAAASQRGISRGQLLGFIALASEPFGPSLAADLEAPAFLPELVEETASPRRKAGFGLWPGEADAFEAQVC